MRRCCRRGAGQAGRELYVCARALRDLQEGQELCFSYRLQGDAMKFLFNYGFVPEDVKDVFYVMVNFLTMMPAMARTRTITTKTMTAKRVRQGARAAILTRRRQQSRAKRGPSVGGAFRRSACQPRAPSPYPSRTKSRCLTHGYGLFASEQCTWAKIASVSLEISSVVVRSK